MSVPDGADEHGSGTLLMAGVSAVLAVLAVGAAIVAVYAIALHQARAGADLAAVSGAIARTRGEEPCRVAEQMAARNDTMPVTCEVTGDHLEFAISLTVEVPVAVIVPGLPRSVRAEAHAGQLERSPP